MTLVDIARQHADEIRKKKGRCVLATHQPDFFPYMGYFYKVFRCDMWVFTDDVLYSKSGRHNYNEILTQRGTHRLTLPIHYHLANLNTIEIAADDKIAEKMVKTIWMEYRKATYFHETFPVIEELLLSSPEAPNLAAFNEKCISRLIQEFGMDSDKVFLLSSRDVPTEKKRDERIVWLCNHLGADTYFSGTGAKDYHIEQMYLDNGVDLVYSDYQPLQYPQVGGRKEYNMSVIDYVLNCGFNIPEGWE